MVISRVISKVTILITHIRGLIAPLITIHEPPSSPGQRAPATQGFDGLEFKDLGW